MAKRKKSDNPAAPATGDRWSFLTNHAFVAASIAHNPQILLREVADHVGITERAVQRIVKDLERDGYLVRSKRGRSNQYEMHLERPLRHPLARHVTLAQMLALLNHAPHELDGRSLGKRNGPQRRRP